MLSYERTPQIERKAGQIESRCCELSYEADKLNSGKDIIKEKPCICSLLSMILMMHTSCLLSIEGATDSTCDGSVRIRRAEAMDGSGSIERNDGSASKRWIREL